jgi:hypothetical protein
MPLFTQPLRTDGEADAVPCVCAALRCAGEWQYQRAFFVMVFVIHKRCVRKGFVDIGGCHIEKALLAEDFLIGGEAGTRGGVWKLPEHTNTTSTTTTHETRH